ncbi:hypothetical protein FACS1894216_16210 [Synergistales bacterium]|nr:hypothetical protein FACS1894216_16210 [Synergistales bacterium]
MGLEHIPDEIKGLKRFVLWRLRHAGKAQRLTKVPYSAKGIKASTNNPIIAEVPGYVEVSPSGTGIHILTRGALPADRDKIKFKSAEFYDETSPRYLTLTGNIYNERGELNAEDSSPAAAFMYRKVRDSDKGHPLLEKIRASKQGAKFAALYDGKYQGLGYPSNSEAVAALLAILAFWTKKDAALMDELFRGSKLFIQEKWERRQNGRTLGEIEIDNACGFCKEVYEGAIDFPDLKRDGMPKGTIENLRVLFEHYKIRISYDEIRKTEKYEFEGVENISVDNYGNACYGHILDLLIKHDVPAGNLAQFLFTIIDENRFNPVKDWIYSKKWDGRDRLLALSETLVAKPDYDENLKETLLRKWLLSAAMAACTNEPFMTRGVLVLAGKQNIGKTRWILSLAPREWIKGGHLLDPENKDSVQETISHWICELGELDSTMRRDIGRLKAFLTLEGDQFRIPYARKTSKFPRRTVFAASVNEPQFLVDNTGNSRFWSIPVIGVHHDHPINMQQVYAQLLVEGGQWWLTAEEDDRLSLVNSNLVQRDEVYDLLTSRIDWTKFKEELKAEYVDWLTPTDVLMTRCGFDRPPSRQQQQRCAAALRELTGFDAPVQKHGRGKCYPIPKY